MANTVMRKPIDNYKEIQQLVLCSLTDLGGGSTSTLQAFPTKPGVYRVGSPTGIAGLPSGINGYGSLLIFNAGTYCVCIYVDNNKRLYWGINTAPSTTSAIAPNKWQYVQGTEVNQA